MKRVLATALFSSAFFMASTLMSGMAAAEDWPEYGYHGIAFKVEYIDFADKVLSSRDVERGIMVGIEGYRRLSSGLYFGAEASLVNIDGTPAAGVSSEINYLPVELNVRYVGEAAPRTFIDVGGGVSYSYLDERGVLSNTSDTKDWMLGGQVFASLNYVSGAYYAGITGKYQMTENYSDATSGGTRFDLSNVRLGLQAGMSF